jgi:putative membrane protein
VLLIEAGAASLALALVMIYPSIYLYRRAMTATGIAGLTMPYILPVITVSLILAIFYAVYVLYRITDLDLGENLFSFVNGAVDRETVTMNYDRVQMVVTAKGPIARLFDVARSNIYLLSSIGGSSITSGYFHERDLNAIGENVMERIASGDYDYRKNSL